MTETLAPAEHAATDAATPAALPFSTRMREASRSEHEEAESTAFGSALVAGELPVSAYVALLGQTYLVYSVLEDAARAQREDPVGAAFWFPELLRVPELERDLAYFAGPDWRDGLTALAATDRYCERLGEVAYDWPGGFVAHQYTRYLGDLSGGQIIRRRLGDAYGLGADGLRFYIFDGIPKPKPFKDIYRSRVDAAPWDDTERARIVDEVRLAFRLNTELFEDLDRDPSWRTPASR
jgi:heme oxygenase